MCTSWPHACIASPVALNGAPVRSRTGSPSSSARTATPGASRAPTRAIRPVPAAGSHGTGSSAATAAAVRSSACASSGCGVQAVAQLDRARELALDALEQPRRAAPQ